MNRAAHFLHLDFTFTKELCMRIPLVLNLLMACAAVRVSLRFQDTHEHAPDMSGLRLLIRSSFHQMMQAARYILRSPAAMVIILTGLLFDSFLRLFYTVGSNYYRLLGIDEAWNGVILASSSILGIGTALMVEKLVGKATPSRNMGMVAVLILIGLSGISLMIPGWVGVLFVVPFWLGMRSLHYFISQYLNRVSEPATRATVLSFKGLTMNLAYGTIMLAYQAQTWALRASEKEVMTGMDKPQTDMHLLAVAMPWWPWVFGTLAVALAIGIRLKFGGGLTTLLAREHQGAPGPPAG
jgi:hypothetical protein